MEVSERKWTHYTKKLSLYRPRELQEVEAPRIFSRHIRW
jgi:hypothetical protein